MSERAEFFGNGIIPSRWNPKNVGVGTEWTLSEALAPLLAVKPWLSVISGMQNKVPGLFAHKSYPAGALTGAQAMGVGDVQSPSIDQLIAKLNPATAFPSGLHAGLCNTTGAGARPRGFSKA